MIFLLGKVFTNYRFNKQTRTSRFFGLSLCEEIKPDKLIVLGTTGSMWDNLLRETPLSQRLQNVLAIECALKLIPYGRGQAEQIDTLKILVSSFNEKDTAILDVTKQQERAKYALTCVKEAAKRLQSQQERNEYKSYAAALPAMIHMNGLGQAAAFFKSKGGRHHDLYNLLSTWLCEDNQPLEVYDDMLEGITKANMQTYRLAQAEAQALMDWVKKFAKAYMTGEELTGDNQ